MRNLRWELFGAGLLCTMGALLATPRIAEAQACPAGRSCFYVPPALPAAPGYTAGWDMVLASPRGTISGTWRAGTGAPHAFSVSPGAPLVQALTTSEGSASGFSTAETRGIFIEASSPDLIVDHRLVQGPWQSSSTVKSSAFSLGTRFRLGGYNLNGPRSASTGYDYASIYAPFGATVTLQAPPMGAIPFWEGVPGPTATITLAPGQTYLLRTINGDTTGGIECLREIDGALVTSTEPIAVDTGGRGWSLHCGVGGNCGDDGADNVLPVSGLGTQFVVVNHPSTGAEGADVAVVADTDGTQVRVNGVLVATLAAGFTHTFPITSTVFVETSAPAYVYQNAGLASCELDIAIIPALALAPTGAWVVDFNVPPASNGELSVVLATTMLASLRLDGGVPSFIVAGPVPGHPELTAARINVVTGNHSIRADADFQLGLVTANGGSGLFAYYTPFRIPGCGDGVRVDPEGCDDGDLDDGDGCSSSCRIEIGFTTCRTSADCVPAGRCDAGTCLARCFTNAECNDSNPCTSDACDATGVCSNTGLPAGSAGGCAAGRVCSGAPTNACVQCVSNAQCSAPTPICDVATTTCVQCASNLDCDDGNACTTDTCASATCTRTPVVDGTACGTGRCGGGSCVIACGDGIVSMATEQCDDGNTSSMDGCSSSCSVETGWSCGCTTPIISYSMEAFAGRVGGDGGSVGPQQGCSGADVLIGLAIDWSNGLGTGVRTTTICGSVSVGAGGVVSTTATTRDTQGGRGCAGWDPSTTSADTVCPSGWAIVGMDGTESMLGSTPTLFSALAIVCQQLGPDGSSFGPTMRLPIAGGSGAPGTAQSAACPAGAIARYFQTRRGCGQDALDLFCGVASAACGGSASVCGTSCGDGLVGAPVEACDDGGESATCDADCTARTCGDTTVNTTAGETCDTGAESATCDDDCTAATCGDNHVNSVAGESCDDGNTMGGDGCSAGCVSESCGNGLVEGAETCDDSGESAACDADCTAAMCGDGHTNAMAGEACDAAGAATATCDPDCTAPLCGDGVLNTSAGEACDDTNTTSGDGCSATCAIEVMPDAGVDAGTDAGTDAGARDAGRADASLSDAANGVDGGVRFGVSGGACSCRVAGGHERGVPLLPFGMLALALLAVRRHRARGARAAEVRS